MGSEHTSRAELYYTLDSGKPVTASPFLVVLMFPHGSPPWMKHRAHHYWVVANEQLENKGYKPLPKKKKKSSFHYVILAASCRYFPPYRLAEQGSLGALVARSNGMIK